MMGSSYAFPPTYFDGISTTTAQQRGGASQFATHRMFFSAYLRGRTVCDINMRGVASNPDAVLYPGRHSFFLTLNLHDAILVFVSLSVDRRKICTLMLRAGPPETP